MERDGIFGTTDGYRVDLVETAHWECKATTAKIKSIAECWMYLKQGLAYCAMSGLRHMCYDVLWILGDYTRPYKPIGTVTLVEFEEREVESWWSIVVKSSGRVRSE